MVDTSFEATYPPALVEKYRENVRCAQIFDGHTLRYVGPPVKTTVRAFDVQHFVVFAEPGNKMLADFKIRNGNEAFRRAVEYAESRGLPWKESGGADVFDPKSCTRWTQRQRRTLRQQYLSLLMLRSTLQAIVAVGKGGGFPHPWGMPAVLSSEEPGRHLGGNWKNRQCLEIEAAMIENQLAKERSA